jgi:hypothetical protein|tara:strand:- start:11 stop:331 length:321 start_codon:yes stop_codon:yes gene_type:complete
MPVTFDNPTNVNGLIIVAFKTDFNETVSLDVLPYMKEIYSVVANPIQQPIQAISTFDSGSNPYELFIPLLVEFSGTTVTLKQPSRQLGTITSTIDVSTSGIIIGRK